MPRFQSRCRPSLETLENRLVPAVKIVAIPSVPMGPNDSIAVIGTAGADRIRIVDDGTTVQVFNKGKEILNPVANPVLLKVALRGGPDRLAYLIPTATVLIRQVDISSGGGKDQITFADDVNPPQGETVDGVALNAGSNFIINFNGAGTGGDKFLAKFGEIQGSLLTLNINCGGGDDDVRVLFHDANIDGSNSIDFDSKVMVSVNLGGAGFLGNFCRVEAGEFTAAMGGNDVTGSSLDVDIVGGAARDVVALSLLYFTIGRFAGPPTNITFDANLGGGNDFFFFRHDAQNILHKNSSLTITVNGGSGSDRLTASKGTNFPGGSIVIDENAKLEINLLGDAGNDQVHAFFGAVTSTEFQIKATGLVKFHLSGGLGNDRVSAILKNDGTTSSPTGIYDVELHGDAGRDRMGLAITDPIGLTYVNGNATLDGGGGVDSIEKIIGVKGKVDKISIP